MTSRFQRIGLRLSLAICVSGSCAADELATYEVTFKDHTVSPPELHVASGKPFLVDVKNANGDNDEFEMLIPSVERAVPAGGEVKVRVRPLGPGRFPFFGESDPDGERGVIVSE